MRLSYCCETCEENDNGWSIKRWSNGRLLNERRERRPINFKNPPQVSDYIPEEPLESKQDDDDEQEGVLV